MIPELNDMLHVSYKHICTVPADQGCAFQRWIEMKFAGVTRKSFLTLMIWVHVGRRVCGRGGGSHECTLGYPSLTNHQTVSGNTIILCQYFGADRLSRCFLCLL